MLIKKGGKKDYSSYIKIKNSDITYIKAFSDLKTALTKTFIIVYFYLSRTFYIDINTSYKFEFSIILFYDKANRVY